MSLNLELNLSDLKASTDILDALDLGVAAENAVTEASALILNRVRTRYLDQTSPQGVKWEPSLAAALRASSGRGGGTLFDTGTLFNSIQLYSISPLERGIGTDVPYAGYSNDGTSRLPPRQFMGFGPEDEDLSWAVLLKKIDEAIAAK